MLGKLDEKALLAHIYVQRVERLDLIELLGGQEALARRRHAEIDHRMLERRSTESAGVPRGRPGVRPPEVIEYLGHLQPPRRRHVAVSWPQASAWTRRGCLPTGEA